MLDKKRVFNITERSNIYIYAPSGIVTGGVELLHQLCDILNKNGKKSYIVYHGNKSHEIPNDYKKYNLNILEESDIEDSSENIVVVPETYCLMVRRIKNAKIILWWLSVDNYFSALQANVFETYRYYWTMYRFRSGIRPVIRKLRYRYPTYSLVRIRKNKNLCNAYQSEYAHAFLEKHRIYNSIRLEDYINDDYVFNLENIKNKKDIIVYNPKKGLSFTKKLIKKTSDLCWIPIQKMTRDEVKRTLLEAKLYIDFGHHPGKDRLPREAAMCGCVILTGKLGAAGFYNDLPIDNEYKFCQKETDIEIICEKIRFELVNYATEIDKFSYYRNKISKEKEQFEQDALNLFTYIS